MPVPVSLSAYFNGTAGALVMSCIAFSIVFLVIIGLMLVMAGAARIASLVDARSEGK